MKVIDLFAGCGGLSIGFEKAGFEIVKAIEYDRMIAETYKKNHDNVSMIIDDIMNIDISKEFYKGDADVIIGGPPCQGFSMAGARIRKGFIDDPRNYLFKYYYKIVKQVRPKIFIMENVKGLTTMNKGAVFQEILNIFYDKDELEGDFYHVEVKVVNALEFGIPQNRERIILIGTLNSKIDIEKEFHKTKLLISKKIPNYFNKVTVWDAISNLENIPEHDIILYNDYITHYQKYLSSDTKKTYNHIATKHSDKTVARMSRIKNGGNWTSLKEDIKSIHSGSYGRLNKEGIAPTITTRFDTPSGGGFIHPSKNRTITPREAARIQSFSDDYKFYGNKSSICKQIGNAVPPKLSYFLAELVRGLM